ncbi:hypothetical protein HDU93_001973 [Gonapodya sp. JEL0774]|nr:hypothetical protein HDU93_001973 [Gonapodya sp. JEL0774]
MSTSLVLRPLTASSSASCTSPAVARCRNSRFNIHIGLSLHPTQSFPSKLTPNPAFPHSFSTHAPSSSFFPSYTAQLPSNTRYMSSVAATVRKAARPQRSRKAVLVLTPSAVSRIRHLQSTSASRGGPPRFLRVGVKSRGCSGLQYFLEEVEGKGRLDEVVEQDGVTVLVDSKALFSIIGSEMDYVEDRLSAKFVFNNPNVKDACGCGESFNVDTSAAAAAAGLPGGSGSGGGIPSVPGAEAGTLNVAASRRVMNAHSSILAQVAAGSLNPVALGLSSDTATSDPRTNSPPKTPGLSLVTQITSCFIPFEPTSPHPDSATPSDVATFVQSLRSDSNSALTGIGSSPTRNPSSRWSTPRSSPAATPRNSPGRARIGSGAGESVGLGRSSSLQGFRAAAAALWQPSRGKHRNLSRDVDTVTSDAEASASQNASGVVIDPSTPVRSVVQSSAREIEVVPRKRDSTVFDKWTGIPAVTSVTRGLGEPLTFDSLGIQGDGTESPKTITRLSNVRYHPRLTRSDSHLSHPSIHRPGRDQTPTPTERTHLEKLVASPPHSSTQLPSSSTPGISGAAPPLVDAQNQSQSQSGTARLSHDSGVSSRHSVSSSHTIDVNDRTGERSYAKASDERSSFRLNSENSETPLASISHREYREVYPSQAHMRGATGPALLVSPPSPHQSPDRSTRSSSPHLDSTDTGLAPLSSSLSSAPTSRVHHPRERRSWFPRPASASGTHPTASSSSAAAAKLATSPIPGRKPNRLSWVHPFSLSLSIPSLHRENSDRSRKKHVAGADDSGSDIERETPIRKKKDGGRSLSESLSSFLAGALTREKVAQPRLREGIDPRETNEKKRLSVMNYVFNSSGELRECEDEYSHTLIGTARSAANFPPATSKNSSFFRHASSNSTSSIDTRFRANPANNRVFGVPLDSAIAYGRHSVGQHEVPAVVFRCLEFLESKGLDEEGIYRQSGSVHVVNWLREQFELAGDLDLISTNDDQIGPPFDAHSVASLLKQYLRDLPEPILTWALTQKFRNVLELSSREEKLLALRGLVAQLPKANRALLAVLFDHLDRVAGRSDFNRMTASNLGMLFAPTLVVPSGVFWILMAAGSGFFKEVEATVQENVKASEGMEESLMVVKAVEVRDP